MTYSEIAAQLEEIAAIVAGWAPIVPPAVATGWVAERLRALARKVEAGGVWPEHNPGIVGSDLLPSGTPKEPRAELPGE